MLLLLCGVQYEALAPSLSPGKGRVLLLDSRQSLENGVATLPQPLVSNWRSVSRAAQTGTPRNDTRLDRLLQAGRYEIRPGANRPMAAQTDTYVYLEELEEATYTGKEWDTSCIGSATSNVRVWINGKMVGYSEDSKLEARFDVSKYVRTGQNVIAMEIFRWCDGSYLEDQDFWRLSGIARGVYL